ncbi:MAG TPA: acyltransferase [Verrucomicrobiota bacterium]|nr:acyltransferase [Verrucomicrobiota bacterium]
MRNPLQRLIGRLALWAPGGDSLRPTLHRWRGVCVGRNVWISQHVYLDELYPEAITIEDNCTIGIRCTVLTHFHWGPRRSRDGCKAVVIGRGTFVGPHCVVLPGVTIGEGCVIKAGTVVSRNVPPRVFWGTPAARALARVTVPLVDGSSYEAFAGGLSLLHGDGPVAE